ncbi:MAG: ATP-grasp domain-containing protein [Lachnospiraceae bacterium]|nr:ATP-grasp domain-containing protein [Lachnospiraceae bacterium]
MKKLLVLGGGVFQIPFVLKAKEMGVYVGLVDINKNSPAKLYSDEFFNESILDIDAVRQIVQSFKPDGISVGTCETAMHTATRVADEFGYPFLKEEIVNRATNKILMLEAFKKCNVPSPEYAVIKQEDKVVWNGEYPVITKPSDKSASRGLYYVENSEELNKAVEISMASSDEKEVLIEEYLDGPEVSVELLMMGAEPKVLQITDKITSGSPYYIELGQVQPSMLSEDCKKSLAKCAMEAAVAVGLENCAVHAEIKMTSKGPKMVELAGRMGGHFIDSYLLEESTGYDLQKAVIRFALGDGIELSQSTKSPEGCAVQCILSKAGVVKNLSGIDEAKKLPDVVQVFVTVNIGDKLSDGKSNNDLIGYVVAKGENAQCALDNCQKAIDKIEILIE